MNIYNKNDKDYFDYRLLEMLGTKFQKILNIEKDRKKTTDT